MRSSGQASLDEGHLEASREDGGKHGRAERDGAELVRGGDAGVEAEGVLAGICSSNWDSTGRRAGGGWGRPGRGGSRGISGDGQSMRKEGQTTRKEIKW